MSLVSASYKVMCSIIHGRLAEVVEGSNLVAEEQGGCRRGRGCRDQLLSPGAVGTDENVVRKEMYAGFIDFRKA